MPKFVYLVQCPKHPDFRMHFVKKTEANNYYHWHLKDCFDAEPPELVEAPFIG